MTLHVIGSSSRGNGYVLESGSDLLFIEAGYPAVRMKGALPPSGRGKKVTGTLVTHSHTDHARFIPDHLAHGIPVYALPETLAAHGSSSHPLARPLTHDRTYRIGSWTVTTLALLHDAPCIGYLIRHPDMGTLLFVTDTMNFPYRLEACPDNVLVECNYADDIIRGNVRSGLIPASRASRTMRTHLSLSTLLWTLRQQPLRATRHIVLLHLSRENADPGRFRREVEQATGTPVLIAGHGLELKL